MGVDQRTGDGSKPRIPRVVSKSDRDHGTATTDNRNLGLTPTVTISRSNLSLSLYPIPRIEPPLLGFFFLLSGDQILHDIGYNDIE